MTDLPIRVIFKLKSLFKEGFIMQIIVSGKPGIKSNYIFEQLGRIHLWRLAGLNTNGSQLVKASEISVLASRF